MRASSAVASSVAPFGELEGAREVLHVRETTSLANGYPARERDAIGDKFLAKVTYRLMASV